MKKDSFAAIFADIKADPMNATYEQQGIDPLYSVNKQAKIVIVGQAPGKRAEESGLYWNDPSGDHLREWLNVSREDFYHRSEFAILPMDFYFPGKGKSGDLPPRKGFAEKWHPRLLQLMPNVELTLLVGNYAVHRYLQQPSKVSLTEIVQHYQDYLPEYFPLVHPSPRNRIWERKNPWFEAEVIPELQQRVAKILQG
ncbi:uracil-DNA glycosylase [Ignatzschineria ureiclastica]|uniref:Uracil-DNA glycosylase n=1 Tax=Ignatzschineria ureiclastica TaxID=472582 RepID=A0A2U2ACL0_9GAMM|nr:uracil-DNA glycosylase family protein [Ignatzschineria ureiclastica]PWD80388.1 uracil-DNA glycosylase [Ignatzschineria ureiclastica]GGZ99872.1 uracil-DNA glycosylase [Ignatzschineria ureiclastica]